MNKFKRSHVEATYWNKQSEAPPYYEQANAKYDKHFGVKKLLKVVPNQLIF